MQLKRRIVASLAVATGTLLGTAPGASAVEEEKDPWEAEVALLYYGERERVTDYSGNLFLRRLLGDNRFFSLKFLVDSLTGASGNGAAAAATPQTFTRPSGIGSYTAGPGETPLDDTFLDTRVAVAASWEQALGERYEFEGGLTFSNEYDYLHKGVNSRFSRYFNRKNTKLSVGVAYADDEIDPEGGAPVPFAPMLEPGDTGNKRGDESKTVTDGIAGITQIINRRMVAQVNYSWSRSDGYLTDPYKLISVVDPATGLPAPGPGTLDLYRFENRPDSREKQSVFAQTKYHFRKNILNVHYRYHWDDWGIRSHTVDLRYRWKWRDKLYLEPHGRFYTQTQADFYVTTLVEGEPLPEHASSDYRLGEFDAVTVGAKYGIRMTGHREWSVRVEYYRQSGDGTPDDAVGSQRALELFPDVEALIVQVGYRFTF